jgi:hypothetical protein
VTAGGLTPIPVGVVPVVVAASFVKLVAVVAGVVGAGAGDTPPTGEGVGTDTVAAGAAVAVGEAGLVGADGAVGEADVGAAGLVAVAGLGTPGLTRGNVATLPPTGGTVGGTVGETGGFGLVAGTTLEGRFGPFLTRSRRAST